MMHWLRWLWDWGNAPAPTPTAEGAFSWTSSAIFFTANASAAQMIATASVASAFRAEAAYV